MNGLFDFDLSELLHLEQKTETMETETVEDSTSNVASSAPIYPINTTFTPEENRAQRDGATTLSDTITLDSRFKHGVNLSEDALLVRLSIGKPKNSAQSEQAKQDVAQKHQLLDATDLRASLPLMARDALGEINKAAGKATGVYYLYTIPWDDKGWRLMPAVHYSNVKSVVLQAANEMDDAKVRLAALRDSLEQQFRDRWKDLADEVEFPTADQIESACKIEFKEMPLANTSDIRLQHCSPEQIAEIARSAEAQLKSKVSVGLRDAVTKLAGLVEKVIEQCSKEKDRRIHDTLISNLDKQTEAMQAFNFYGDTEITRILRRVKTQLASIDPDDLRDSQTAREQAAKTASSVLDDLKNFKPVEN